MIHKMFSIYDSKAEIYLPPFYFQTKGQAIRAFSDSANDTTSQFYKHSEDYTMFEVGEFEDSNCTFNILPTPLAIGKALDFRRVDETSDWPK